MSAPAAEAIETGMPDLRDVPLAELEALGPDVLRIAVGRALQGDSASSPPAAAFQSSI